MDWHTLSFEVNHHAAAEYNRGENAWMEETLCIVVSRWKENLLNIMVQLQ